MARPSSPDDAETPPSAEPAVAARAAALTHPVNGPAVGRRWPARFVSISTVLAWVSLACFVAGALLWLLPVRNKLQSCGTPAAFLATGRQTVHAAPAPPGHKGFTKAEAASINRNLCSTLVADRAVPAAGLVTSTLVLGIVGFILAALGHRAEWRDFATATGRHLPTWKESAGAAPPTPPS